MNPSEKLIEIDRKLTGKEELLTERRRRLHILNRETEHFRNEARLLTAVDQVLLTISSKLLDQSTQVIDRTVTAGLRLTFDDQSLEFKTSVGKYRGKTAIFFELLENGRSSPIMSSYGGGVLVTAGVLLRVVTILTLNLRKFLVLDESLSHLSQQYIPNVSKLLKKLSEELNFKILMVSHQEEFAEEADLHYQARGKDGGTTFDLVKKSLRKGEGPGEKSESPSGFKPNN